MADSVLRLKSKEFAKSIVFLLFKKDCVDLRRMLVSSVITLKNKQKADI